MGLSIDQKLKTLQLTIDFFDRIDDNSNYEDRIAAVFDVCDLIHEYLMKEPIDSLKPSQLEKKPIVRTSRTMAK